MIYILFKTAYRFLIKNNFFTIINITGLSVGITAFFLIILFLQNETGYESHIPEADRIYRLVGIQEPAGLDKQHAAYTSGGWSEKTSKHIMTLMFFFHLQLMKMSSIFKCIRQQFTINIYCVERSCLASIA